LHCEDPLLFCKFLSFLLGSVELLIKEFKVFSSNLGAFAAIWVGFLVPCFNSLVKLFQLLGNGSTGIVLSAALTVRVIFRGIAME